MQLRVNIPPLTRVLLALTLVISLAYQVVRIELWATKRSPNFLALIPQWSLFYPWVYFTATFAEQNIFTLIIAGLTVFFGGRYMERAWGSREFGKFVLLVILVPNFVAALLYVLWFAMTKEDEQAWATIQGSVALQGAFLVAFKQLVPEHTVTILKGFIRIRVKHFPAIFLAANTISGVVLGTDTALVLAWLGFMTSWTYLRFYKKQSDLTSASTGNNGIRGDASETFAFPSFWPDAVQPPIAVISSSVYHALVVFKICTPFSAEEVEWGNQQAMARGEGGLPSLLNADGRRGGAGKREEAERRRALALRALDQKLYATTANRPTAPQTATASHTPDPVISEEADGGVEMTGDSH